MTDWAEVYRTTFPDLVRYLHRKVWDADLARDLAQDAFARALASGPAHEPLQSPQAWVFRIASNLAHDEARSSVRRRRHLTLLRDEAAASVTPDPAAVLERQAAEDAARSALEQLSDRDREALLLWDAGFNYIEIAAQTGLAVGAIGTTLSRARRRLVEAHAQLQAQPPREAIHEAR
jgi:RNA polymerase sigma-70 factor, ECF subfamily